MTPVKCTCLWRDNNTLTQVDPLCPWHGKKADNVHDAPRTAAIWDGEKFNFSEIADEEEIEQTIDALIDRALDNLVAEGKIERCVVDGAPGFRLTEAEQKRIEEFERQQLIIEKAKHERDR